MAFLDKLINILIRTRNRVSSDERVYYPDGHFYSPIPSKEDLSRLSNYPINDINFRKEDQFNLLKELVHFARDLNIPEKENESHRYYYDNNYFSYSDGTILASLMRFFKPSKIIEIGSGFSSALMMDINDRFLNKQCNLNFIEPFESSRLKTLVRSTDKVNIMEQIIQDVPISTFNTLEKNDFLFVDSSHISKKGSDLNHILFNILPHLNPGVIIHFHDIFNGFEYPSKWLNEGVYFNECYLLQSFLMNNDHYEILYFNDYLENEYEDWFKENLPICLRAHEYHNQTKRDKKDPTVRGQSLYIRKLV